MRDRSNPADRQTQTHAKADEFREMRQKQPGGRADTDTRKADEVREISAEISCSQKTEGIDVEAACMQEDKMQNKYCWVVLCAAITYKSLHKLSLISLSLSLPPSLSQALLSKALSPSYMQR